MFEAERSVLDDPALRARYRVADCIGGGAFSTVYEATQCSTGQRVALKVLRLLDAASALRDTERFRRETQLCAQLHHPNIVRLIDSGELGECLYAVFELVPGVTLAEVLAAEGGLAPTEALHLMTQVLDALSCSHGLGIVHRDLKPANIMVTSTGARRNALVLDFGLGVVALEPLREVSARLTIDGEYLGTPLYSAPEQLYGQAPTVLSDLYAWGLIFIECLTGAPAISGRTTAEVVHSQLSLHPVPIPKALATHSLGRLLRSATIKQPAESRASAAELLRALQQVPLRSLPGRDSLAVLRPSGAAPIPAAAPLGGEPLWSVPLQRNANFTGRREALLAISELLTSDPPPAVVALCGLGGIGKTQIALEYAVRHAAEYDLVAWLHAEGPEALAADYAALTKVLGLPERETHDQYPKIEAVRKWLARHRRWLLVFDNAPTPEAIRAYLPPAPIGHVLATSRHQSWRSLGAALLIDVLRPDEAAEFLAARIGAPHTVDAERLCEELGRLPLALEEAAAYIEATGRSVTTYRRLLESNRRRLLGEGTPPVDYPWTVRSTWEISLRHLEADVPHAVRLLSLCAYLAPDDIPLAALRDGLAQQVDGPLALLRDEIEFDRCVAALRRYSLVKTGDGTLSIHRLVQVVTRDRLPTEAHAGWAQAALQLVEAVYPRSGLSGDVQPASGRLLPHALAVLSHAAQLPPCDERAAQLLSRTGIYLSATGDHTRAAEHLAKARRIVARHPTFGERERAALLANVAVVQNARGELEDARDLFEQALALHERLDGPDSLSVGLDLVNLAWVRRAFGDLLPARAAGARAARILHGALGPQHPILATLQSVTARVLWELGEIDAARAQLDGVLAMLEHAAEAGHPMAAGAWFQTGLLSFAFGDLARAAQCAQRGTDVGTPAYGPDHPLVLSNVAVAGQVLLAREELGAAQLAFERVVSGTARTCARPHADLAISLPLLAEAHGRAGNASLARRIAEEALATSTAVAGERTVLVATAHWALGNALTQQGDLAGGGAQLTLGREIVTSRFGSAHPALLPLLGAQARLHLRAAEPAAAAALCERAVSIATAAHLEAHLEVATALALCGEALQQLGRRDTARERVAQAAAIIHQRLGAASGRAARVAEQMRRLRDA